MKDIKYLIVHHTERNNDFPAFINFRHKFLRGWDKIGYHYLIGNRRPFTKDGFLYAGRKENETGAHAFGFNEISLGICLIGNLDKSNPTLKQLQTLVTLLKSKMKQYGIPAENVLGHRELSGVVKTCPGKNLDMEILRQIITGKVEFQALVSGEYQKERVTCNAL